MMNAKTKGETQEQTPTKTRCLIRISPSTSGYQVSSSIRTNCFGRIAFLYKFLEAFRSPPYAFFCNSFITINHSRLIE